MHLFFIYVSHSFSQRRCTCPSSLFSALGENGHVYLHARHEPDAGLLNVGEIVVFVVGQVVGLSVEGVVWLLPLELEVERGKGAETLGLSRLGIVELPFPILEREVPLGRE